MSGELRIVLLLLGLVAILAVYFHSRRKGDETATNKKRDPENDPVIHLRKIAVQRERAMGDAEPPLKDAPPAPPEQAEQVPPREAPPEDVSAVKDPPPPSEDSSVAAAPPEQAPPPEEDAADRPPTPPEDGAVTVTAEPPSRVPTPEDAVPAVPAVPADAPIAEDEAARMPDDRANKVDKANKVVELTDASSAEDAPPPDTPDDGDAAADKSEGGVGAHVRVLGGRLKRRLSTAAGSAINKLFHTAAAPAETAAETPPPPGAVRLLVLHIRAPADREFYGREVLFAAEKVGLQRSDPDKERGAFEKPVASEGYSVRFYMADMFEPGFFEWDKFEDKRVRGLSLFARLTEPGVAAEVFQELVKCARTMATLLEGSSLLDEKRSTLTNQTISHMCEKLREEVAKSGMSRE